MELQANRLYQSLAILFLIIVAIAFAPSYWIPLFKGTLSVSTYVHLHAAFASVWILLYLLQVSLIKNDRYHIHMYTGYGSIIITVGVIVTGILVSLDLVERSVSAGNAGAKPSLLINLTDIGMFALLYIAAITKRKISVTHKKLMTLAVIVLMNAGLFRIGRLIIGPGFGAILLSIILTSLLIILFMLLNKKLTGTINPVLKKAGVGVIIVHIVRIPLAVTPGWSQITDQILLYW